MKMNDTMEGSEMGGAAHKMRPHTSAIPSWQKRNYYSLAKKINGSFSHPIPLNAGEPFVTGLGIDDRGRGQPAGKWKRADDGPRKLLGTFSFFQPLCVGDGYYDRMASGGRHGGECVSA